MSKKYHVQELLVEQGKRIRALHEIISRPDLSFDEQIDETLHLGCALLGTEIGKVGRQDLENNISEFLNTVVTSDLPVKRGTVLPLDKTFCQVTFASAKSVAISHVSKSEYKNHPAASFLGMESYIGCSINVFGKKYGTVNFSNRTPVKNPFTDADKDLVNLIGSWISVMMERQLEAEELRKAKDQAERANKAKSEFLANMSHEIRTPLTAIIGYSDFALSDTQTEEERKSGLKIIRSSGKHLLHLINEILDFSKIEAGELDIIEAETHVKSLLQEVESIVSGQAKLKNLDFKINYKFPIPECIQTDDLRLKQILINLCSNAIKFTETGGVEINVAYSQAEKNIRFKVIDTGIGLTVDQINTIFKPFKQADAGTTRKYGGTGLGLSLSTRLAKLLNGELTVKSKVENGSEFELLIRLNVDSIHENTRFLHSLNEDAEVLESEARLRLKGNILVADDEIFNQELLTMYINDIGASVTIAENGQNAVDKALKGNFDLIYMDMQMPVLSGVDAVKTLREANYTGPIVMLSANATRDDRMKCEAAGCDDFVTKPIDSDRLYEVSAHYLSNKTN